MGESKPHAQNSAVDWSDVARSAVIGASAGALAAVAGFYVFEHQRGPGLAFSFAVKGLAIWGTLLGMGRAVTAEWRRRGVPSYYLAWAANGTVACLIIMGGLRLFGEWGAVVSWWPEFPVTLLILGPAPGLVIGWWLRCWGLE